MKISNFLLHRVALTAASIAAVACLTANAQMVTAPASANEPATTAELRLPDAPSFLHADRSYSSSFRDDQDLLASAPRADAKDIVTPALPEASHTQELIEPGQTAPQLSTSDDILLGLKAAFSPFAAVGWLSAAGYEHIFNNSPNYGTDRGAFGQRLGASALRAGSEGVFSESVFAPIFHEDPRYYRLGPSHSFAGRVIYSITRPLINRTNSGKNSINFALLLGNLAGAELTHAYYPPRNKSQTEIMETFGGSIGGSAVGYAFYEFLSPIAQKLTFQHK